jgi:hypothetical protein
MHLEVAFVGWDKAHVDAGRVFVHDRRRVIPMFVVQP